ncbi:Rv1355c family protein [Dyadobacter flavalbus]|uniref:Rv1355c family protein n=1 Tax=Dyadobacter flavalbus TaxID=2579942 RepID=A0A5M8QYV5_9BACT|nr:Rv1355c family protein [Dyadobacter flavalbus]KAA6441495.1 Rv1355c family protein [Dyadobacter flavalbus]
MYHNPQINSIYKPVFISRELYADQRKFRSLMEDYREKIILDLFSSQKKELIRIRNPRKRLSEAEIDSIYADWSCEKDTDLEGCWIYYPWSNRLLHILDKDEFIELRTTRNHYKIAPQEQIELSKRKIGIIGLSVGHAVAITMATERVCGSLKLADFDTLELSNLNRIRTGIHNIGINKCIITAREIAEIDPFLEIECYPEGITHHNITGFMTDHGKLDILVDECDDLEIKIYCREMAKSLSIPVVMETSDRGMLDVERFDLAADRPILHGLLNGIPHEKLKNIAPGDRVPLVMKIIDAMKSSHRGRASLLEVGQSISTWPQLASAVTLGGGVVTDVCRRILLNQFTDSGRYYVDLEELVANKLPVSASTVYSNPNKEFDLSRAIETTDNLPQHTRAIIPTESEIRQIVETATGMQSIGNDYPWKWLFRNGRLHLFHDTFRSYSFANYNNMAAHLALGAAYENVITECRNMGYEVETELSPSEDNPDLLAIIHFTAKNDSQAHTRTVTTNTEPTEDEITSNDADQHAPFQLDNRTYHLLQHAVESVSNTALQFITDKDKIDRLGRIIGECNLIMMLNDNGHHDFFERNMDWSTDNKTAHRRHGVISFGNSPAQLAALAIMRDKKVANAIKTIGGGNMLVESVQHAVGAAPCIAVVRLPKNGHHNFFSGGISAQRLWLQAEELGLTLQPLLSPLFLFARIESGDGLNDAEKDKLRELQSQFHRIIESDYQSSEILILKVTKEEKPVLQTPPHPLDEILFMVNNEF